MSEEINVNQPQEPTPQPAPQPAPQPEPKGYTQEQLDAIVARERKKATNGWFTGDQMAAKDAEIQTLTTERDTAKADMAKLQAELNGLKNEKYLSGKGVPAKMIGYYAFEIGKLVNDKTSFEKAAEEYLKENPPVAVQVSTGGEVGGSGNGNQPKKPNEIMNALIRGVK